MSDRQLRVFSLNCWGLKFVAKNRNERVAAIAASLAESSYDIVALQELWVFADYQKVRESVRGSLPYSKFFYSGALGAGLVIFSRFPIIETSVNPYSLNGAPIDVIAGDWFVGKAAASIVIAHPLLGEVQIFNTHLFAKGGEDGPEHNRAHRLVNAWEFAKLAKQAAQMGRYVIALGDFNSVPTTLPMTVIRDHAALSDAWVVSHPSPSDISVDMTSSQDMIQHYGVTADSPVNSYSAGKPLDPHARKFLGKRLDYILYRQPVGPAAARDTPLLTCSSTRVTLTEPVPGHDFSYSDHFGLEATLDIIPVQEPSAAPISTLASSQLTSASIDTVVQALTACHTFSQRRSNRELAVFGLCILLLLGLIPASAVVPAWASPVLMLVTVVVAWYATTMFYEGFLYGRWELNALMNVIEELEIHQNRLDGVDAGSWASYTLGA
ncbi:DNase I-like protein [Athelia psychrophila]|uniref:DNase I-like protein n=1 Tax=Athelia psychrophila TaxID=1759441 RepID=A0A166RYB3_9AGAM|nr:DNase I-like protein [Fibularhizoctonia sp. CBS 109695]